jgi:hypothetical protein
MTLAVRRLEDADPIPTRPTFPIWSKAVVLTFSIIDGAEHRLLKRYRGKTEKHLLAVSFLLSLEPQYLFLSRLSVVKIAEF